MSASVHLPPVRQELTDLPAATVTVPPGTSNQSVHQAFQDIDGLGVRVAVEFAQEPTGGVTTTLRAPEAAR